jgi:hypothetical protein
MRLLVVTATLLATGVVQAAGWTFTGKLIIAGSEQAGVFHHLDAGGRKNMAVSGDTIAVVWEDNRSGQPQIYAAFRKTSESGFSAAQRLSGGQQAFEPAVTALGNGRFLFAWEQDGQLWLRARNTMGLGPPVMTRTRGFSQASLAAHDGQAAVVFVRQTGKFSQVASARVAVSDRLELTMKGVTTVDAEPPRDDQLYPSVALNRRGVTVAWEDRRRGHTVIQYSHAPHGQPYSAPKLLNELVQKSEIYGRGSGVTRVALATPGDDKVVAVWMDKRGFLTGYDIYAAHSSDGGASFGKNEVVQDEFGNEIAQWHPAVATGPAGQIAVAFDDNRDDSADIWLAWREQGKWSANVSPPPASGPAQQANPVVAFDGRGNVHLAWIERDSDDGPTRIFYSMGRR